MSKKKDDLSVSPKNTKQEILEAYNALLIDLKNSGSAALPSSEKIEKVTENVDTKLTDMVEAISKTLNSNVAEVLSTIRDLFDSLKVLQDVKSQEILAGKREQEEYNYTIQRERRVETDKWLAEKYSREQVISEKESRLKDSEDELKTLRQRDATFDTRLDEAVEERVGKEVAKVSGEYEHKMELQNLEKSSEIKLLKEKISNLENMILSQREELMRLNKQVDLAGQRLADVAGSAVGSSRKYLQGVKPDDEVK